MISLSRGWYLDSGPSLTIRLGTKSWRLQVPLWLLQQPYIYETFDKEPGPLRGLKKEEDEPSYSKVTPLPPLFHKEVVLVCCGCGEGFTFDEWMVIRWNNYCRWLRQGHSVISTEAYLYGEYKLYRHPNGTLELLPFTLGKRVWLLLTNFDLTSSFRPECGW